MKFFTRPIAVALFLFSSKVLALTFDGHVYRVSDADTVRLTVTATCQERACPEVGDSLRIRLAEIDAPEDDQPYGAIATEQLSAAVKNQKVSIRQTDVDQYGRIVGHVIYQGNWINAWLVSEGHAWVYPEYATSRELFELEDNARNSRRGLWAEDYPVEPWVWRHR